LLNQFDFASAIFTLKVAIYPFTRKFRTEFIFQSIDGFCRTGLETDPVSRDENNRLFIDLAAELDPLPTVLRKRSRRCQGNAKRCQEEPIFFSYRQKPLYQHHCCNKMVEDA